ncbi:MAG: DUF429 domain-containing protein [Planctomycetia bacterium]|nr:DUF429 domain-containing protein [Planctomycetia bacterium]
MTSTSRQLIGVDFSSAPTNRKPITVAVGQLVEKQQPVYRLETIRELPTLKAFEQLLAEPGEWIGGFDLPFGQPRALIEHEGWPTDWPTFVQFFCGQPRETLRETFRQWCNARPVGSKFAWRQTDKPAGSSPAMRWTNPPVAWMMHAGIGRMLAAGLAFPAHRHPLRGSRQRRIALEAYPGFTARQIVRGSYKSDTPASQTPDRRQRRRQILTALTAGTAGLAVLLEASPTWQRRMLADGRGDLLDAVLCSLQAGHAAVQPKFGLPRNLDPLEGWIAAVPVK